MLVRALPRTLVAPSVLLAQLACGGPDMTEDDPTLGTGLATTEPSTSTSGEQLDESTGGKLDLPPPSDLPLEDPEECVSQSAEAELVAKPVDVVLFVDTSGSMESVSNAV